MKNIIVLLLAAMVLSLSCAPYALVERRDGPSAVRDFDREVDLKVIIKENMKEDSLSWEWEWDEVKKEKRRTLTITAKNPARVQYLLNAFFDIESISAEGSGTVFLRDEGIYYSGSRYDRRGYGSYAPWRPFYGHRPAPGY